MNIIEERMLSGPSTREASQELINLSLEAEKLLSHAAGLQIKDEASAVEALLSALLARKWLKSVEENKKKVTAPYTDFIKCLTDSTKTLSKNLVDIECEMLLRVGHWMEQNDLESLGSDLGSVSKKEVWVHNIENFERVPLEYCMLDVAKVKEAIKNGVRRIPGLSINCCIEHSMRLKAEKNG